MATLHALETLSRRGQNAVKPMLPYLSAWRGAPRIALAGPRRRPSVVVRSSPSPPADQFFEAEKDLHTAENPDGCVPLVPCAHAEYVRASDDRETRSRARSYVVMALAENRLNFEMLEAKLRLCREIDAEVSGYTSSALHAHV